MVTTGIGYIRSQKLDYQNAQEEKYFVKNFFRD